MYEAKVYVLRGNELEFATSMPFSSSKNANAVISLFTQYVLNLTQSNWKPEDLQEGKVQFFRLPGEELNTIRIGFPTFQVSIDADGFLVHELTLGKLVCPEFVRLYTNQQVG